jgi:hypothetical protein
MSLSPAATHARNLSPSAQLFDIINGLMICRAVQVAAEIGVADHLEDGARHVEDLAEATGTHAGSLYRLLRALASYGIFAEDGERRFEQTPLSHLLRSDIPESMRDFAAMRGDAWVLRMWTELGYSIKTGKDAFSHVHQGLTLWEYFASENPESGRLFSRAMSSLSAAFNGPIAGAYDFSTMRTVADVGGAHGSLLTTILGIAPHLKGVLFDRPSVIEEAPRHIPPELRDRVTLVGGDMFQSIPEGADAYILRFILHNWGDEQGVAILKSLRRSMGREAKLLVVESIVPPGNGPSYAKLLDLAMLVQFRSRERTEEEFRQLLAAADFELARVVPTSCPLSIMEAVPV